MRQALFTKMVEAIQASLSTDKWSTLYKKHDTEEYISYTWLVSDNSPAITKVKEHIKIYGYKATESFIRNVPGIRPVNEYSIFCSIFYTKATGKISLKETNIGIGWSYKKERFYPMCQNLPLLCLNKKLYMFIGKNPRLYKSNGKNNHSRVLHDVLKVVLNIGKDVDPKIPIPLNYDQMYGMHSTQALLEKATGVKIPKVLCKIQPYTLYSLISVMRNPNELNTLAQFISKKGENADSWYDQDVTALIRDYYNDSNPDNKMEFYLLRDWIWDMTKLKLKNFSLTIRSKERIADEHTKMSREIRKLEMKPIEVHQKYVDFFEKNEEFKTMGAELITTKERLLDEGTWQDHCVASYGGRINMGDCAIISFIYKDKRYTLELRHSKAHNMGDNFYIGQLQGFRNCREEPLPEEFHKAVLYAIEKYNPVKSVFPAGVSTPREFEQLYI